MKNLLYFLKELASFYHFFKKNNKVARALVFYAESPIYFRYYEGLITRILNQPDGEVCYITSMPDDPVFKISNHRMKVFYFHRLLPLIFLLMDAKIVVMTMTGLNQFHIRKSINNTHYVYVFHALVSTHMLYHKGAFDFYDTIFCAGPHQVGEIRKTEELYHLPAKKLIPAGYPLLEKLHQDHQRYLKENRGYLSKERSLILVAPGWGKGNILESCIQQLIPVLTRAGYRIVIRPHPEFVKRSSGALEKLITLFAAEQNVRFELDLVSEHSFHEAAALITDWSGVSLEYAFATENPVLFINTPRKIHNPDYLNLSIEPLEVHSRNHLGESLDTENLAQIDRVIGEMIKNRLAYRQKIIDYRNRYVFNWGKSSEIGTEHILGILKN
ncbi:MAG: CDP-glycerol glycerophosphotransferase family protein [Candidatus Omnitrophica bacterium]|nr:CDP-glycerol glycerophosphotransferase family protein [Candidatus Omnitrophota bacterium]